MIWEAVDDAEGKFARFASIYGVIFLAAAAVYLSRRCIMADGYLPGVPTHCSRVYAADLFKNLEPWQIDQKELLCATVNLLENP